MNAGRWMWVMFVSMTVGACAEAPATGQPLAAQSTTAATPAAATAPVVDPAKGIGPIRIGMTQDEVEATKLSLEKTRPEEWHAGPYRLLFEGGRVVYVAAGLRELGGAVFGGAYIPKEETSIERIAAHLPGCGKLEMRIGANVITCADGTAAVLAGGEQAVVSFQVYSPEYAKRLAPAKPPKTYPSAGPPCSGGGPCGPGAKG